MTKPVNFTKIGAGACGAIFAADGDNIIYKLAKSVDYHDQVWNDYLTHAALVEEFRRHKIDDQVQIPKCHFFVPKDRDAWFEKHPELVAAAQDVVHFPTCLIVAERIMPLPRSTREALIDKFCRSDKDAAKAFPANRDCLIRVYLGSLKSHQSGMMFSLRNFKMHLQQMVDLHLDVEKFSRYIGRAMAVIHWAAKKDGRDIEFILGSSPTLTTSPMTAEELRRMPEHTYTGPASYKNQDFFFRTTEMFVIDFNQVQPITMDQDGVDKAVEAATINDPYLPKPLQETAMEKKVWDAFVKSYLDKSEEMLGTESDLPCLFLEGLEEVETRKQAKKKELLEKGEDHYGF